MTEPKVSERIDTLLTEYALAVVHSATSEGLGSKEVGQTRRALLSAIVELEQRAEKWKEAAVAVEDLVFVENSPRLRAAIAALGDEWTEAVR